MVSEFDSRVAAIPKDLCAPFYSEAARLENELLMIYKFVALCVRNEEDLQIVSNKWGTMVTICDDAIRQLGRLCEQHPECGAASYYDQLLDLRARCHRLQQLHS